MCSKTAYSFIVNIGAAPQDLVYSIAKAPLADTVAAAARCAHRLQMISALKEGAAAVSPACNLPDENEPARQLEQTPRVVT